MTTPAAANLYLAEHLLQMEGKRLAHYNPHGKPINELPVIYGFNNGGSPNWYSGVLIAEDGSGMGGHICSAEAYMHHDLGILEGTRLDRHKGFKEHYPDGYRMEFISSKDVLTHPGLELAYQRNQQKAKEAQEAKLVVEESDEDA
jgi:hypothetical protein